MGFVKSVVARISLALAMGATVAGLVVTPAHAGSWPVVYRQAGNHYTPLYGLPGANVVQAWLPPGNRFSMQCWTDLRYSSYGNYWSVRWFRGQAFTGHYGYVHSSYVYYQWSVPRC
jgi:hypothetical protein